MRRPLTYFERRHPNNNLNEKKTIEIYKNTIDSRNKVDRRNVVEHTFTTTDFEDISHKINRLPKGFAIVDQSALGAVAGENQKWTNRKLRLKSSVAPNTVRIQIL